MAISLVTYNVLADAYAEPSRYPHVAPDALRGTARTSQVAQRLAELRADVLCLQEMEPAMFDAVARALGKGWRGELAKKGAGRPDGSATLARTGRVAWLRSRRLEYEDGAADRTRSGHVALVVEVEHEGRTLAVANTHLRWDPARTAPEARWALREVRGLLDARATSRVDPDAWVVCGDMNVEPDDAAIRALLDAGLRDAHEGASGATAVANGRARRIDFVLVGSALDVEVEPLPALDPAAPLPDPTEPSDHVPVRVSLSWRR